MGHTRPSWRWLQTAAGGSCPSVHRSLQQRLKARTGAQGVEVAVVAGPRPQPAAHARDHALQEADRKLGLAEKGVGTGGAVLSDQVVRV